MSQHPIALQLRYLQTMVEMASERTSTIIPIPLGIFDWFKGLNGATHAPDKESLIPSEFAGPD
jgi:hypothetical protein